jgi:GTPase SAR1 family protein
MIGDEYFRVRAGLGGCLDSLRGEAEACGASAESLLILDNLKASLKEPFVFVVVGEVNVGKSTFLNALFGQDFSRTGIVPTTEKILFFKHGDRPSSVPVTPTLEEVSIPCEFLRDFHIVDTPGTNSIMDEHQQITERFVPVADLVIFVFSAVNPWGASAWQFLEKVHREWMRNVVFVLQQCDLRTAEEVVVITDYMRQLCAQRFGREFPLFPVSARHAYLARSSGVDREGLLKASGFTELESHISRVVTSAGTRTARLGSALKLARQCMGQLRQRLEMSAGSADRRADILEELVTEGGLQLDRTLLKIQPAIDATERDYHQSAIRVATLAATTLSTSRAFHDARGGVEEQEVEVAMAPPSLDHRLFQDLQQHNSDRWRQVALILEEDVRQFSRYVEAKGRVAMPAGSPQQAEEGGESEVDPDLRKRFTARVDSAIRRFVVELKLDETVEPGMKKAVKRARMVPRLLPLILVLGGVGWWLQGLFGAAAGAGAGLLLTAAFFLLTRMALGSARRQLIEKLEASSSNLHALLSRHVEEDVQAAFARFESRLKPVLETVRTRQGDLQARRAALDAIEARLNELDESLRRLPAAD